MVLTNPIYEDLPTKNASTGDVVDDNSKGSVENIAHEVENKSHKVKPCKNVGLGVDTKDCRETAEKIESNESIEKIENIESSTLSVSKEDLAKVSEKVKIEKENCAEATVEIENNNKDMFTKQNITKNTDEELQEYKVDCREKLNKNYQDASKDSSKNTDDVYVEMKSNVEIKNNKNANFEATTDINNPIYEYEIKEKDTSATCSVNDEEKPISQLEEKTDKLCDNVSTSSNDQDALRRLSEKIVEAQITLNIEQNCSETINDDKNRCLIDEKKIKDEVFEEENKSSEELDKVQIESKNDTVEEECVEVNNDEILLSSNQPSQVSMEHLNTKSEIKITENRTHDIKTKETNDPECQSVSDKDNTEQTCVQTQDQNQNLQILVSSEPAMVSFNRAVLVNPVDRTNEPLNSNATDTTHENPKLYETPDFSNEIEPNSSNVQNVVDDIVEKVVYQNKQPDPTTESSKKEISQPEIRLENQATFEVDESDTRAVDNTLDSKLVVKDVSVQKDSVVFGSAEKQEPSADEPKTEKEVKQVVSSDRSDPIMNAPVGIDVKKETDHNKTEKEVTSTEKPKINARDLYLKCMKAANESTKSSDKHSQKDSTSNILHRNKTKQVELSPAASFSGFAPIIKKSEKLFLELDESLVGAYCKSARVSDLKKFFESKNS